MLTKNLENSLRRAVDYALSLGHEHTTLEHLLYSLTEDPDVICILKSASVNIPQMRETLWEFITTELTYLKIKELEESTPTISFQRVLHRAILQTQTASGKSVDSRYVLAGLFDEKESHSAFFLRIHNLNRMDIIQYMNSHPISLRKNTKKQIEESPTLQQLAKTSSFDSKVQLPGFSTTPIDSQIPPAEISDKKHLKQFCINLNERALSGKIDPVIGRHEEIERVIEILSRRTKNNPILVGEAGVGKTAIAEGLAIQIVEQKIPVLMNSTIYSLDLGLLLAGTRYRGDFEERLKNVVADVVATPGAILFIDEIHNIVGAGSTQGGGMDASNLLKPALARGEIRCIGATTHKEFRQFFEKDRALTRRFQKVEVEETNSEDTLKILEQLKIVYESYHAVLYSTEVLKAIVELSVRYIHNRALPDKAIDVLDEVGAQHHLKNETTKSISLKEVEETVAKIARIPKLSVTTDERKVILNLRKNLKKTIFGQDRAIDVVVDAIQIARAGLSHQEKPMGSFLFAGPTGVGKTELARQISSQLGIKLLRFDMSEYMEKHSVAKLIGTPPGYVGYEQGGLLTEAIDKNPHAVLLLDEIEKAHPDLFSILLQIMDYGKITDNAGREIDCRHLMIVLTTNAGAIELSKFPIGFGKEGASEVSETNDINRMFTPEFRNRLDGIVTFHRLSEKDIIHIFDKFLGRTEALLRERNISITITPKARKWFIQNGYSETMGARPMERLIQEKIKLPLSKELLTARSTKIEKKLTIDLNEEVVVIRSQEREVA
ncbi:MAG: AAA family ATPase [Candidatus Paracaedibacteraceae bacterium]|nr:AAA family ATPase [Candidatus Paracaedibacteraceae bacterium]